MSRLSQCVLSLIILTLICTLPAISNGQARPQAVRKDAQLVVHTAALGLSGILKNVQGRQDKIRMIREFVTPVRFFPDQSGYFYVYDMQGLCIAHAAQPDLDGQNMYDFKDVKGFHVVQALIKTAKNGGGFMEYNWEKPGSDGLFEKLGYVETIPGTDFFIGSGIYLPEPW